MKVKIALPVLAALLVTACSSQPPSPAVTYTGIAQPTGPVASPTDRCGR